MELPSELRAEVVAIAAESGCTLLEAQVHGGTLRVVLDRIDGPVTLTDCTSVSRQVSALLDVADYGSSRYVLEVSSPGLDRPLHSPDDFKRFTGNLIRVRFAHESDHAPADSGNRRSRMTVVGRLEAADDTHATVVEAERDATHSIPYAAIERARLEIDL